MVPPPKKESTHGWRNPKHTPREELSTETGEETRWWKIYHENPVSTVTVNDSNIHLVKNRKNRKSFSDKGLVDFLTGLKPRDSCCRSDMP